MWCEGTINTIKLMNLNQITVPVLDVETSIVFYLELGMQLIVKSRHYARFIVPDGEATFSIHKVDVLPKGEGVTVYFEDENLDKTVKQLVETGSYESASILDRKAVIKHQLSMMSEEFGERVAVLEMRKHCSAYLKGLPGSARIKMEIMQCKSQEDYDVALSHF